MTTLETLARDLREAARYAAIDIIDGECGYTIEFSASPLYHQERYTAAENAVMNRIEHVVARHVQKIQREAWIAGRDAAAEWHETEAAHSAADLIGKIWHHRQCAKALRTLQPPARKRPPMAEINIAPHKLLPDAWRVEIINMSEGGRVDVMTFSGPNAEQLAKSYAEWMKAEETGA